MKRTTPILLLAALLFAVGSAAQSPATLTPDEHRLYFGVQPLGYPTAMLGAVLRRDRILDRELQSIGLYLVAAPFRKGSDIVEVFGGNRVSVALLGDMPAIRILAQAGGTVIGLAKQTHSSVVARNINLLADLRGRRIGYLEGSSAHHTLLQGLTAAGITEQDVTLLPVEINDMPDALEAGRIDAFAAWEPAPTIAASRNPANRVIFRGPSSDYLIMDRDFAGKFPAAPLALAAAQVRAIRWMRSRTEYVEQAARWAQADGAAFIGSKPPITVAQAVTIARRELLDIPSAPLLPPLPGDRQRLREEFDFLLRLGKLGAGVDYERVRSALQFQGIQQVQSDPRRYRLDTFDYRD